MGALERAGSDSNLAPQVRERLTAPSLFEGGNPVFQQLDPCRERFVELCKFSGAESGDAHQLEASAAQTIEHRHVLRDAQWIVQRQNQGRDADSHPPCAGRDRRRHHQG